MDNKGSLSITGACGAWGFCSGGVQRDCMRSGILYIFEMQLFGHNDILVVRYLIVVGLKRIQEMRG